MYEDDQGEEHSKVQGHGIHSVHDESYLESQLKAPFGVMLKKIEHPYLGLNIDEMQVDVDVSIKATRCPNDSH